jgi:ribonuclease HI
MSFFNIREPSMYTLRFDGLFRGVGGKINPKAKAGFMCYGWIIIKNGKMVARGHGAFGRGKEATSLIAEYLGLIEGLEAMIDLGAVVEHVKIIGDAKSVIDQMDGSADVNSPSILPLYRRAQRLAAQFNSLTWSWTARKNNREADRLTRRAMKQLKLDRENFDAAVEAIHPDLRKNAKTKRLIDLLNLRVYLSPTWNAGEAGTD